jgi:hypothetical protein
MTDELLNQEELHTHRPIFLAIICIIGFIGSAIGIVQNARGYFHADIQAITMSKIVSDKVLERQTGTVSDAAKKIIVTNIANNLTEENYTKFFIGGVFSSILTLIGCVFMWMLKRTGFYSFALGTFFNLVTHFLLYGENVLLSGNSFYASLVGLGLLILFATNLKNMD